MVLLLYPELFGDLLMQTMSMCCMDITGACLAAPKYDSVGEYGGERIC